MTDKPHVHHLDDVAWETRPGRTDGVRWKLLIDSDRTPSHGLSLGILQFPPGTVLAPHHHGPQEIYWIREGTGEVLIDGKKQNVRPNSIIYIPENHVHGIENIGTTPLTLMWVFPTDTWGEVEYLFE
ncbi:MAG: cupin domain-containing protein [Rhodospirillaceae bacterium]|jgi:mannose-6-phosphate isomerase-like protein (cupin superfamily)|nr:cupin domain-containing protein [Rhodospirillaceae bacterium]MBT4487448.1 cupin domain-containing protein [Rhodospirillaceae bacterium]MBT5193045.1 cupin domain-containing protein [Rhodospirillaceae bacterium]MBT5898847.1 cupin domain-containing protein [Rhodospirillaceae bacterium]MBT7760288.1 cupin domain-containing protein [Rhodospirillaceae bacterium]